jgi:hypothetical protein
MMSQILRLFVALTIATHCLGLSTLRPPSTNLPSPVGDIFAKPVSEFQRWDLKKKLIRAAEQKNEPLVLSLVEELAKLNPTDCPTLGLAGYKQQAPGKPKSPLNGPWRLLFTNAKDAEAPARTEKGTDEPFGDSVASGVEVTTGQRIDAVKGECVNFISLENSTNEKRPFDKLEITIKMTPLSDTRVRLDFLTGRVQNARAPLPFLRDVTFNFPPATVSDFVARLRGKDPNVEPQAYFDVLYIDDELRAHRTGEGKVFVQARGQ